MTNAESHIDLPTVPAEQADAAVAVWREPLLIDTYEPQLPTPYPAYLETRVYQGSSGRVYPLPFHEQISPTKTPRSWDAIHLENEWIRLVILPELGGRIHIAYDKTRDYDVFYRNNVIKPALVGLAGPWISGGIEFNWPQHHRPGTYLPTDASIEQNPDGSVTVWCSDHDPFARMKGMHGITLHPDRAVIEVRVRAYNRTDETQTFLWWSNVAALAGDDYQAFFPADVHWVADHAKRATTTFPRATGRYYGWDYPAQVDDDHPDADRIDWYKNVPVPTSYMCVDSTGDFFGGYDHGRKAGFVHWADHHISPGKKQWTWGNSPFGWAWDRNLTDGDGPYVELMAGVYTDNQPDFSFLAPGETKSWSQYWYPIQDIGPAHQATLDAAVSFDVSPGEGRTAIRIGLATPGTYESVLLTVTTPEGAIVWQDTVRVGPGAPVVRSLDLDGEHQDLVCTAIDGDTVLVRWRPEPPAADATAPDPVRPALLPEEIGSVEELYLTGRHLEQYRHPTRAAEPYWEEALSRDPGHIGTHTALAALKTRRAQYAEAEGHLRQAITRLTSLNPNPYDGEPLYLLGQVLRRLGRPDEAYDALAKATWNAPWRAPAGFALAQIDVAHGQYGDALGRLDDVLAVESGHLRARNLRVIALRRAGRSAEAEVQLDATRALDPLDWWAADLAGTTLTTDAQTCLDIALEYRAIGADEDALRLVEQAVTTHTNAPVTGQPNPAPLLAYYRAELLGRLGRDDEARKALVEARTVNPDRCLLGRLDDVDLINAVLAEDPKDARAHALLGHWLYFQRRYDDAMAAWRRSTALDPGDPVVWRNLGIAAYNILRDPQEARDAYDRALEAAPRDPKLRYESDQLDRRRAVPPAARLAQLAADPDVVAARHDLSTEYARLLVVTGEAQEAVRTLSEHAFQPWEGGEGMVLGAWDQAHHALAHLALSRQDAAGARRSVEAALEPPLNLGEGRQPLANCAHLWLTLGDAHAAAGDPQEARGWWVRAASFDGDFEEMATRPFSTMTAYSILAWQRLGEQDRADELTDGLRGYVDELALSVPKIDYFATSFPTMLLFHEDLQYRQDTEVLLLRAQLAWLDGKQESAAEHLADVVRRDPANAPAATWRVSIG